MSEGIYYIYISSIFQHNESVTCDWQTTLSKYWY